MQDLKSRKNFRLSGNHEQEAISLETITPLPSIVHIGIGVFDGIHHGHQAILKAVLHQSETPDACAVVTFEPHPLQIIAPEKAPGRLSSLIQKEALLRAHGMPKLIQLRFDSFLRHLPPVEFVRRLCQLFPNLETASVGSNWRFGYNGTGSALTLADLGAQFNFATHIIPPVLVEDQPVSSTRIREAILRREFLLAEKLLGRPYSVGGRVVVGDGRGQTLGFPTANVDGIEQLLPPPGVYCCETLVGDSTYRAMVNLGRRPTFGKLDLPRLEAHLLEFRGDLYGKHLDLSRWEFLREEQTFETPEALQAQIALDIQQACSKN